MQNARHSTVIFELEARSWETARETRKIHTMTFLLPLGSRTTVFESDFDPIYNFLLFLLNK